MGSSACKNTPGRSPGDNYVHTGGQRHRNLAIVLSSGYLGVQCITCGKCIFQAAVQTTRLGLRAAGASLHPSGAEKAADRRRRRPKDGAVRCSILDKCS